MNVYNQASVIVHLHICICIYTTQGLENMHITSSLYANSKRSRQNNILSLLQGQLPVGCTRYMYGIKLYLTYGRIIIYAELTNHGA